MQWVLTDNGWQYQSVNVPDVDNISYQKTISAPMKKWCKQGSTFQQLGVFSIPQEKIPKSSILRVSFCVNYYTPAVAGKKTTIRLNGVVVGQVFPISTHQSFSGTIDIAISSNGLNSIRAQGIIGQDVSTTTDGTGKQHGSYLSGRATSAAISLSTTNTLEICSEVSGSVSSSGEFHELAYASVQVLQDVGATVTELPSNMVACWGDSLTAGTGAVAGTSDYPTVLAKTYPYRPYYNGGVGGETAQLIVNRLIGDSVMGKIPTLLLWVGRNNVGSPTMQNDVLIALDSAVKNLTHSRFLILTVLNATTEPIGSANYDAIISLNNAILAAYPNNSLDIRSILATEPNGTIPASLMSDTVHLNATGYAPVASNVSTFLDNKGW